MNNKEQVLAAIQNIFSFTLNNFFAHNVVENIKKGLVRDSIDGRYLYVCPMKSMSIVKDINAKPQIFIHESSIIPEAISFWYHGLNCAELINPFDFVVEYENKEYILTAWFQKEDKWFHISGSLIEKLWSEVFADNKEICLL